MSRILLGVSLSIFLSFFVTASAVAQDWNSSPNNWQNDPNNWENSPNNWKNNPNNWENSPNKWGNERIIRDGNGVATGYAVPKADGGINVFDLNGNRSGYVPSPEK